MFVTHDEIIFVTRVIISVYFSVVVNTSVISFGEGLLFLSCSRVFYFGLNFVCLITPNLFHLTIAFNSIKLKCYVSACLYFYFAFLSAVRFG